MNLAQNKFLVGYGAVVLLGVAGLGYHLSSESSRLTTAQQGYAQEAAKYNGLRKSELFPDAANLKRLEEQKESIFAATQALQDRLAPLSFPLEPISPQQFQDKLGSAVSNIVANAQMAGIELPAKFFLGFEDYESSIATPELAPLLYREMRVIESVISTLISAKVSKIGPVSRALIPGEGKAASPRPTPAPKAGAPAPVEKAADLITKYPFTVEFVSDQRQFRTILNTIATNDKQFIVIRDLKVKNTNPKTVSKESTIPVHAAQPVSAEGEQFNSPVVPPTAASLQYVLGTEKVEVILSLDMIVVASRNAK